MITNSIPQAYIGQGFANSRQVRWSLFQVGRQGQWRAAAGLRQQL